MTSTLELIETTVGLANVAVFHVNDSKIPLGGRVDRHENIGEGKISGWISVILGSLSVLGVLCFHFPDFLTTPQLRQAYTADQMRYLLGAGMIFSASDTR